MTKNIICALILLAIASCSDQNRSFLYVTVCPNKYIVDDVTGNDLQVLLAGSKKGWASVQIKHPEFINEQRLVSAKSLIHQFTPASVVGVVKVTETICTVSK